MISPKAIEVINMLYNKTMDDQICWGETLDEGTFQLAYPTFTIKIFERSSKSSDEYLDIVVQIFNENAVLVEEITDVDLNGLGRISNTYEFMKNLYQKARAQALGVEKVMNDILIQLESRPDQSIGDDSIPF